MNKEFLKDLADFSTVGAILGAAVGFGLSFTALPTLVMGGIIGCSFLMLLTALGTTLKLFGNQMHITETENIALFGVCTIVAAGFGVGLAAAAGALFPGFMLSGLSAVLAGAEIGGLATTSSLIVGNDVIAPAIEWVAARLDFSGRQTP